MLEGLHAIGEHWAGDQDAPGVGCAVSWRRPRPARPVLQPLWKVAGQTPHMKSKAATGLPAEASDCLLKLQGTKQTL